MIPSSKLPSGLEALASGTALSPFSRLRRLLDGVAPAPGLTAIELAVGEPHETMPAFVSDKLREAEAEFARYPNARGSLALRRAIAHWLVRRYGAGASADPETEILALNGSREGLFYAAFPAVGRKRAQLRSRLDQSNTDELTVGASGELPPTPAILMPNPYYQAYFGAGLATDADPVMLDATAATGHLPDLDALAANAPLLHRTAAFYLCSPANPQGAVASRAYIAKALALARAHDFLLFFDECYSEIYAGEPPPGGLEVAAAAGATGDRFANLVVFNSLSKRSNLPGLRSGFCAGDANFIETFAEVRNLVGPTMPGPVQHASAAVWAEEQHVAVNRLAYRAKYAVCDRILGTRYGYSRPAGGFFLWLDMGQFGGGEAATVTLWKRCAVKVVPGAYLAQAGDGGENPGTDYVRVALVASPEIIGEALSRIVTTLS